VSLSLYHCARALKSDCTVCSAKYLYESPYIKTRKLTTPTATLTPNSEVGFTSVAMSRSDCLEISLLKTIFIARSA